MQAVLMNVIYLACCKASHGGTVSVTSRAVLNILFGPNSRPNSVFVFGRIVVHTLNTNNSRRRSLFPA